MHVTPLFPLIRSRPEEGIVSAPILQMSKVYRTSVTVHDFKASERRYTGDLNSKLTSLVPRPASLATGSPESSA